MMPTFHFRWSIFALRALVISATLLWAGPSSGQPRLVIHNNAYVRIDNAAWVVVANPATNAITTSGSGGNIRSEGELNRVRWQIRDNVGTYDVPFTSINGVKIPFSYSVLTAGSNEANASIVFSTYNHASTTAVNPWENDLYRPSDVTHMNSYNAPSVANSQNAVDRFWIVDPSEGPYAYGSKPSVDLGFIYENTTVSGDVMPLNAITTGDPVGAQRFNSGAGLWGDMLPMGAWVGGPLGSVLGAAIPASDFYRSWTLASLVEPLPVTLLKFDGACSGREVVLDWSTATESNSAYFQVERSLNGKDFIGLGRVQAAGNSITLKEYRFIDSDARDLAYYRLRQLDLDGSEVVSNVIVSGCSVEGLEIVNAWDDGYSLNLDVRSSMQQDTDVHLLDTRGRLLHSEQLTVQQGITHFAMQKEGLAMGVYVVRLQSSGASATRRVTLVF